MIEKIQKIKDVMNDIIQNLKINDQVLDYERESEDIVLSHNKARYSGFKFISFLSFQPLEPMKLDK